MSKSGENHNTIAPGEVEATAGREKENETALAEDGGPPRRTRLPHQREPQCQPTQLSGGYRSAWRTFHVVHRSSHAEETSLHCTNDPQTQALHRTQREPGAHVRTEGLFPTSPSMKSSYLAALSLLFTLLLGHIQRNICTDSQQSIHDLWKVQGESFNTAALCNVQHPCHWILFWIS